MVEINLKIEESMFKKAENYSAFREDCKKYLTKAGKNWDKFTVVSHDSFVGYLAEIAFTKVIKSKYPNYTITNWEDQFDIRGLIDIIENQDYSENSVQQIVDYFYDKWDISIESNNTIIYCDVKTALTKKEPSGNWNFLYPVIQANKLGKDITSLFYYVIGDINDLKSYKKFVLVGFTDYEKIKNCPVIKAGDRTRFGTVSQIDNYITELGRDYSMDFETLFN